MKFSNPFRWFWQQIVLEPLPNEYSLETARQELGSATNNQVDLALEVARDTARHADETNSQVEGKASQLTGFVGVISGFILGVLAFVASRETGLSEVARGSAVVGFGLATLLLVLSLLRAQQVVRVERRRRSIVVAPETAFEFVRQPALHAKREWAASLTCAAINNYRIVQWKADALRRAQFWFVFASILIVVSTIFVFFQLVVRAFAS